MFASNHVIAAATQHTLHKMFNTHAVITLYFPTIIIYISMSWILVVLVTLPITFSVPPLSFRIMIGGCWPLFKHNFIFILMYNLVGILIPILIVSSVNMKIVGIAKYHQFRIANALFGITPFGPAELHAAVKERQKDTLR